MTETEHEEGGDFTAPDPHEVPDGVDPDTGEIEEQTPGEAADADGSDALIRKAEKARANFARRIRDIFGDAAPQYDCPACDGLGMVWTLDETVPELVHPDTLVTCDACNGYGQVLTGSKNPERATTVCIACSGNGFRTVVAQPENVTPITPPATTAPAPVMGWMGPDGVFVPLGQAQGA